MPLLPVLACFSDEPPLVVFSLTLVVPCALPEAVEVTLSFLVFEELFEPLGVFRTTIVDFVPIPVCKCGTL